jgi:hypothetical protein
LIHQDMDFASLFCPIGWIIARIASTQRRSTGSTVYRLPFPLDMPFATIETQQRAKNLFPNAFLLPSLKPLVQYTTRNAKPGSVNCFPLTTSPQNEPQTVHDGTVRFSVPSGTRLPLLFGKVLFYNSPHSSWHLTIFRTLRFCGILFHDVSRLVLVWRNRILSRIRLFVQLLSILG